jgi:hypothetical protein
MYTPACTLYPYPGRLHMTLQTILSHVAQTTKTRQLSNNNHKRRKERENNASRPQVTPSRDRTSPCSGQARQGSKTRRSADRDKHPDRPRTNRRQQRQGKPNGPQPYYVLYSYCLPPKPRPSILSPSLPQPTRNGTHTSHYTTPSSHTTSRPPAPIALCPRLEMRYPQATDATAHPQRFLEGPRTSKPSKKRDQERRGVSDE